MSGKFGAEFVQLRRISKEFPQKAIGLFGLYEKLKNLPPSSNILSGDLNKGATAGPPMT